MARTEAIRLAKHILELDEQLVSNEKRLDELVRASEAARLAYKRKGSGRSVPQSASPRDHTKAGFVTKRRLPLWLG